MTADSALNPQAASMEESGEKLARESHFLGSNSDSTTDGFRQVTSSLHLRCLIHEMGADDGNSSCVIFLRGLNEVMPIRYLVMTKIAQSVSRSQPSISGSARSMLPGL